MTTQCPLWCMLALDVGCYWHHSHTNYYHQIIWGSLKTSATCEWWYLIVLWWGYIMIYGTRTTLSFEPHQPRNSKATHLEWALPLTSCHIDYPKSDIDNFMIIKRKKKTADVTSVTGLARHHVTHWYCSDWSKHQQTTLLFFLLRCPSVVHLSEMVEEIRKWNPGIMMRVDKWIN